MQDLSHNLLWWISAIELPALSGLFWMIWRTRKDSESAAHHVHDTLDIRTSQLRESLAAFKLEVAKNYAPVPDVRALESRIVAHLLRIESKLDQTALKTEALRASRE